MKRRMFRMYLNNYYLHMYILQQLHTNYKNKPFNFNWNKQANSKILWTGFYFQFILLLCLSFFSISTDSDCLFFCKYFPSEAKHLIFLHANLGFKNTHEQANFQWRKERVKYILCFVKDITIELNVIKNK